MTELKKALHLRKGVTPFLLLLDIPRARRTPGHDGIGLDKAPQRRIVPPRAIVVQAQADFLALTGVFITGQRLAAGGSPLGAVFALGVVAGFAGFGCCR